MAVTLTSSYKLICSKNTSTYSTLRLYGKLNSQSTTNNTSSITLQARIYGNGGKGSWSSGSISITATSGTSTSSTGSISYSKGSETTLKTLTTTVAHNSDGTYSNKSVSTSLTTSASPSGSASGTITLPTIPRASQPSANPNPIDVGSTTRISTNKMATEFTHTLSYVFGTLSGTLGTDITDYYDWTIPSSFYNEFTSTEAQKNCTVTCVTYNGATTIGTNTLTLGIKIPDTNKPTYTSVVKAETNPDVITAIGSSMTRAIINLSKPRYQMTLGSQNGAYLKNVVIRCGDLSNTIDLTTTNITSYNLDYTFQNAMTSNVVTITITDTRDMSVTYTDDYSSNYDTYTPITITSQQLERTDIGNNEVTASFNGTMQPKQLDGTTNNTISASYRYKTTEDSAVWSNSYTLTPTYNQDNDEWYIYEVMSNFTALYNYAYIVELTFSDASTPNNQLTRTYTINKAVPSMSLGENDLQINGDLIVADEDGNNGRNILEDIGDLTTLTTTQTSLVDAINEVDENSIEDYYFPSSTDDGYIKYKSGLMIQWKTATPTASMTLWTNPIYYYDYSFGNWDVQFTAIYSWHGSANQMQYWASMYDVSTTSAGTMRLFRPNSSGSPVTLTVYAIGKWK